MSPLLLNLLLTLGVLAVLLLGLFAVSVRLRRWDVIDAFWGAGFAAVALVSFALSDGVLWHRLLITGLTVLWGVRLAWHILRRNLGQPEDKRYVELMARARGNPLAHLVTRVYLPQGAVLWVVSLPVQVGLHTEPRFALLTWLGIAVWLVGFVFETVGDWQLARFKADPANEGRVMDRGLWRYTRHPNYFGDAAVWWGLWLLACHSWLGVATAPAPLLMTYVLTRKTGKALLERHLLESRPGYRDYVRRTSGFFPLPPKKI